MSRPCPNCVHFPLRATALRGIEVSTCDRCQGHWLEHGELERLAPDWKAGALRWALHRAPRRCPEARHPIPFTQEVCGRCGALAVRCPTCEDPLSHVQLPACAVDVCAHCHGLWLDKGEVALLRPSPEHSRKTRAAGAAVAAATTAALLTTQASAISEAPRSSALSSVGESVAKLAVDVAVEGILAPAAELGVDVAAEGILAPAAELALEGAAAVGSAVSEAMAAVLSAVLEGITS